MAEPAFSICVYLGSRPGNNPLFTQAAQAVGRWIGEHRGQLVYGGGNSGLMGVLAQATKDAGGRVVGIIPRALVNKELANRACDELHIVQTMHERKAMMAERSDAFLAIPGGIGTLEELFEVWTWRQLGYHDKPIGVLDADGYYRQMLGFLEHSVQSGFMGDWQMELVRVGRSVPELLAALVQEAGLPKGTKPLRSVI
ncbi:MAG: Rossman fold protein, TIGR00730 family [Comamonas sp. SCN 67-35]|uniref:LOG family protein n=1 Tax=unclassified Comamonas TaxID=2638500 RepID=UPI00086B0191|nr:MULTISPECIES: TIGR00730 family Rossman fold protein [unclassified Comamonas]MBN9330423.1 TIGR00730 family Rossman fold protein [Comamonas sp.]ODU39380.1 MAG: Rossman fold protein, TIGR00730 family [Comamonas sp. SCN 67-35]OJW96651.1 MAG: Rossman fold protein, TIGR00730 family [Burkholderiales bacterium 66-26]